MEVRLFDDVDDIIYLKMRRVESDIFIYAVNNKGVDLPGGHILTICDGGEDEGLIVLRMPKVNKGFGFSLDIEGKIECR